jgi:hypothetical protein
VCNFALPENDVGVHCKTAAWERVAMRTYTLKLFVSNYLNCEKGIKTRATRERYIKIIGLTKTSEGRSGTFV